MIRHFFAAEAAVAATGFMAQSALGNAPTGTFSNAFCNAYPGPSAAWQPTVTSFPTVITRNQTYNIYGYLFNGMSQANFFGDDVQNSTNYPIIRVTMDATPNHVYYGRTHDHSSMGVTQTTLPVSTKFELWDCAHQIAGSACVNETGPATLVVIANGIPSVPVNVTIQ
jgi:hypothetical protein